MTADRSVLNAVPPRIPQDNLPTILIMFAWPAVWYTLLIYVLAGPLIPQGGTTPTWLRLLITGARHRSRAGRRHPASAARRAGLASGLAA